jgi:signal transduction histidine kinase
MAPQRFQRVNGVTLVVRSPNDMAVLKRPPWWTPVRLMAVVGVLLLAVVGFFIWNRFLQRVINRKSRQLLRENIANIKASLRIDERTNLAVELHDSLSQNLSGVACQIAATKGTLRDGSNETARYLATAEKMLSSCRTELRRCLWDLRENALDENDFATAIRKTLAPVAIGVETQIRFDVPRNHVNDRTAHAILCIIRELVSNAIRHGKANTLRIDGELDDHALLFSVVDNGCGFDPDAAAGANEGHFGIEGIRERIKRLGGTFTLKSSAGSGCVAEIKLRMATP